MAKLADLKTKANTLSVDDFLAGLKDEQKRKDSLIILKLMQKVSKEKPVMWGSSLIGFGKKIYESPASGRKVEWFKLGFSPRKTNFSIYVFLNDKLHSASLKKLGKHKTGVGCLYINKLEDIDVKVLEDMMRATYAVQ